MLRNNFCAINENISRRQSPTNSQFLKHVMYEEEKSRQLRVRKILMTSENPMIKEQQQNEQICSELRKLERKKFLEEKRKALLHQNEDEIRQLDVQLKRANIQQQLVEQKEFKENKLKDNLKARLADNKNILDELKRDKELALEEERESAQKKNSLRQELLKQMQDKVEQREKEKKMINDERAKRQRLLANIQKDIANEKQIMLTTKQLLRTERDEYLKNLELYKSQKKFDAEEDHKKYLEWQQQRDHDVKLRQEKRKQALGAREALSENIGLHVFKLQLAKQKREDLLSDLLIGERVAKDDERFRSNLEKQSHRAKNLGDDFLKTFAEKQQETASNRQKEKITYQEDLKVYQDLVRKDIEIRNLKLPKNKQYREDLLNAIKYKEWQRGLAAKNEKGAFEQELIFQQKHQQELEAEKLRLLKAQPLENLKFLPPKAISTEHRLILGLTCKETKENKN